MTAVRESATYLKAARDVATWLAASAVHGPDGRSWPTRPTVSADTVPSLGWGGIGPIVFFADAARTTGDPSYLDHGEQGARWLRAQLDRADAALPPGLFTGLAGFAVAFSELGRAGLDTADDVLRVVESLRDQAIVTGHGVQWWDTTEVLWGTAGIGFLLVSIGARVLGAEAIDLAARAGDWLLGTAYEAPGGGLRWDLGDRPLQGRPQLASAWFPNFAHGTAGIGAYLARLAVVTNDDRYLTAARRAADWVLSTCRTEDGGCAARHHEPGHRRGDLGMGPRRADGDDSPVYTLGWCHGPPGLGWFFRELHLATGDPSWAGWIGRTARTVRSSGIPERREPGFWDNVGRCCGSAGVVEYFLDLHTWRAEPDDLRFATVMLDDLLRRATVDEAGMRWSNVEFRNDPPALPPETTFLQGASGIGATLLRFARHLQGDASTIELPHAPVWQPESR